LRFPKLEPRYNIAPTQSVTCVRNDKLGQKEVVQLRWGLVPFWAKDTTMAARMINARADSVATKPAFRAAFKQRRCLVPTDGFFEWQKTGKEKQPYYITRVDDQPFCMAGLWEHWSGKDQVVESFTIITTEANEMLQMLHDRMPVVIQPDHYDFWLDPDFNDREMLQRMLVPYDENQLKAVPVSKTVNKPSNDVPECILPLTNGD
jgi:putative SOS response-associated peptidase YedK